MSIIDIYRWRNVIVQAKAWFELSNTNAPAVISTEGPTTHSLTPTPLKSVTQSFTQSVPSQRLPSDVGVMIEVRFVRSFVRSFVCAFAGVPSFLPSFVPFRPTTV